MKCPVCGSPNNKPLVRMPAVLHCQDCGYLWNVPSTNAGAWAYSATSTFGAPTPEELKAAGCTWEGLDPKPAMPENGPPLDYDESEFAVCLSSRIFAKDIVHDRTSADIVRRNYRCECGMAALVDNLRRIG